MADAKERKDLDQERGSLFRTRMITSTEIQEGTDAVKLLDEALPNSEENLER